MPTDDDLPIDPNEAANQLAPRVDRQARTRALRVAVARTLVTELAADETIGELRVYRADRTPAYLDPRTRRKVARRLKKPEVVSWIRDRFPQLLPEIAVLKELAFANIDAKRAEFGKSAHAEEDAWTRAVREVEPVSYVEGDPDDGHLVMLQPMKNEDRCPVCHGEVDAYEGSHLLAVRVIRRPLERAG